MVLEWSQNTHISQVLIEAWDFTVFITTEQLSSTMYTEQAKQWIARHCLQQLMVNITEEEDAPSVPNFSNVSGVLLTLHKTNYYSYTNYTAQPVLTSTSSYFARAKFYCLHAHAHVISTFRLRRRMTPINIVLKRAMGKKQHIKRFQ